jgi:hypothetical protein
LHTRGVGSLKLVLERWLRGNRDPSGGGADNPHASAKDGDRTNEHECFVVRS